MKMTYQIERDGQGAERVMLSGPIDESLLPQIGDLSNQVGKDVTLVLKDVTQINSIGTRSWIEFLRVFCEGRTVRFSECSFDFLMAMIIIPSMTAGGTVESFYYLAYCSDCATEDSLLLNLSEDRAALLSTIEKATCPSCNKPMDFDEDPDVVLSALDNLGRT